MVEIIWTEPALDDLDDIFSYISISNPQAARKLVNKIYQTIDRLEIFPESGRVPPENIARHYREVIDPCRVVYKYENSEVYILYVFRQERDLRNYLIQESETEYVVE